MEYTIMWREIWQPGYIDATFLDPEPEIMRINVRYRTGIESDIVGDREQHVMVPCPQLSPNTHYFCTNRHAAAITRIFDYESRFARHNRVSVMQS